MRKAGPMPLPARDREGRAGSEWARDREGRELWLFALCSILICRASLSLDSLIKLDPDVLQLQYYKYPGTVYTVVLRLSIQILSRRKRESNWRNRETST